MVTTVGMKNDLKALVSDFIQLEQDAIAAYDICVERLEDPGRKAKVEEFRADHHRHLEELRELAERVGAYAPDDTDSKGMLTTGKVKMADMVGGDGAVLRAMATNESDTVTAYERGAENDAIQSEDRELFARALKDEERHKAWMEREAESA